MRDGMRQGTGSPVSHWSLASEATDVSRYQLIIELGTSERWNALMFYHVSISLASRLDNHSVRAERSSQLDAVKVRNDTRCKN